MKTDEDTFADLKAARQRADILQAALERAHATLNLIASIGFGKILDTPENRANTRAALDDASHALAVAGLKRRQVPFGTAPGTEPVR